jgi:hypothetical protein
MRPLLALEAHAQPLEARAAATEVARPDARTKRCQAAQRRVERQKQVIDEVDARIDRERKAREACRTPRQCAGLDRALKASDARKSRHERQLAQYEADANAACASVSGR